MRTVFKKRLVAVLIVMIGIGALAYALWPREPRLVMYTSSPITFRGETVRLQSLIPAVWQEAGQVPEYSSFTPQTKKNQPPNYIIMYVLPSQPLRWLPDWLKQLLMRPQERDARIELVLLSGLPSNESPVERNWCKLDGIEIHSGYRNLGDECVIYHRNNKPEFESTYRRICNSLKVIK